MANNENLKKGKATQFSSNNQPENRGRKPSVLKFIKDSGLSITDVKRLLGSLIWEYDSKELAMLLKDKDNPVPVGMAIVLGSLTEDLKNNNLANFDRLMDRAYGRPDQGLDIKTSGNMEIITMTREEKQKRVAELLNVRRKKKPKNESGKIDG
jgi:hypothetical protein